MPVIDSFSLSNLASDVLINAGCSQETALKVANNLVVSNLKGHDSHGVGMLPRYIAAIKEDGLNIHATSKITKYNSPFISFDGQAGFGQVVGHEVIAEGIKQAKQHGFAITSLANAHHLGRIGAFAEQAADTGFLSIHFANVYTKPIVVPWGGVLPRFGTNPFCIGVPVKDQAPVILDFATSIIASGKARIAFNKGEALPSGYAVDPHGIETTDPRYLVQEPFGGLMPFGLHKGSGLSLICSLLGAALTGGLTERTAAPGKKAIINNMLSIIVDPKRLGGEKSFEYEIPELLAWVKQSHPESAALIPGENEREQYAWREKNGIDIDESTWSELQILIQ